MEPGVCTGDSWCKACVRLWTRAAADKPCHSAKVHGSVSGHYVALWVHPKVQEKASFKLTSWNFSKL